LKHSTCIRSKDMIQYRHESENYWGEDSGIPGEEVLSMRFLLPKKRKKIASSRVGLPPPSRDSKGIPYTPQRREQGKQSNRELRIGGDARTSEGTYKYGRIQGQKAKTYVGATSSPSKDMARFSGWTRVPLEAWTVKLGTQERKKSFLQDVWQGVQNAASRFISILSPKLQSEGVTEEKKVREIRVMSESQQFYNLDVEDTHNFVLANGCIVHNSYDSTRYGLMSLRRPALRLKRKRDGDPWADEPEFIKKLRDKKKKKWVNPLTGW